MVGPTGAEALAKEAAAVAFVHDAFSHLKIIRHTDAAADLLMKAGAPVGSNGVLALAVTPDTLSRPLNEGASGIANPPCVR